MPGRKGAWATLVGTVFAHRVFDIIPVLLLILYVIATASIPSSARATLLFVIGSGSGCSSSRSSRAQASPARWRSKGSARCAGC